MKKLFKFFGLFIAVLIIALTGGFLYIKSRPVPAMEVRSVDISSIKEGIYRGEYMSGPVKVIVDVVVKDHKIQGINIIEHQNGLGKKAETIVEDIVEAQSLKVEVVSGATFSSKVILKAVESALEKGKI